MNRHLRDLFRTARLLVLLTVTTVAGSAVASNAHAGEPYQRFLDGLRERGLYDVAVDYLNQMSKSSLVSDDIKKAIPYELGKTLIEWAREDADTKSRAKNLELAREKLQKFMADNPTHEMSGSAAMQLGNVLVLRGTMLIETSARPSNALQKETLLKQAREVLEEAKTVFKKSEDNYEKLVNEFKGVPPANDPGWVDRRDAVRQAFLQANLYSAAVLQEIAKTYTLNSKEHKEALQVAADKYRKIYERWRNLMAGQLARVKQGQCLQDLGEVKTAIGLYNDILNQPDDLADFRKLKASALYRTQQCWLDASQNNPELAHKLGKEFLDHSRPDEVKTPDWLAVRFYTAQAAKKLADTLPDKEAGRKKLLIGEARDDAKLVSSIRGTYRDDARSLLSEITGKEEGVKEPATFAEASERGQEYLDQMQTKEAEAKNLGNAEDPKKLRAEALALREKAVQYFMLALKLRDNEVKMDDVNAVRYYLCFLDYQAGKFYDAAVLGEFLARKYPGSAGGRPGAKIALAAYLQGYNDKQMPPLLKDFDKRRMFDLANYIAGRWKGEPEADDAWGVLLALAVMERDLKGAEEYLAKIPEDAGKRGDAEIKVGQTYWAAYVSEQRKDSAERMPQKQIDALIKRAQELLEAGIKHSKAAMKSGMLLTQDMVLGALSLSQVYLNQNMADKAVTTLEDKEIGPMALVTAKNPVVTQPGSTIPTEAYKTALRAYVETKDLDKAQTAMKQLEELVSASGAEGQAELTRIYVSMGRALEEQIRSLKESGKNDDAEKVTKSFEVFLDKISSGEGANFSSLNWVAETFYSLGAGFDAPGGKPATGQALEYYQKALSTDEKTLKLAEKDKKFLPGPDAVAAVELRIARVYRRMGKFKESVDLIEKILREKPMLVEAQIDGARAFMDWGVTNPAYYSLAIVGARKDAEKKNVIFGWLDLARRLNASLTSGGTDNPQVMKTMQGWFFESRYWLAVSHTNLALAEPAGEKRTKLLNDAINDVKITARFNPVLMTDDWKEWEEKFDAQVKTVQKLLNEKPEGMKVLLPKEDPLMQVAVAEPTAVVEEASDDAATPTPASESTAPSTQSEGPGMGVLIGIVVVLAAVVVVVSLMLFRKPSKPLRPSAPVKFEMPKQEKPSKPEKVPTEPKFTNQP
ncbi:MAG TPA: hypothetical protein VHV77_00470 [Pirellulales bacterium]|nr:hypothetical protein [Pirellulales bacterium]